MVYGPTFAAGRVAFEIVAWTLVGHGTSGFGALLTVRGEVPWQDRHIEPPELSRTRKFKETVSPFWTCGLWQLSHSTLPLISVTFSAGPQSAPSYQTCHQVRLILQRVKAERMRVLQVGAKNIASVHLALHLDLPVGHRLARSNGSIVATQAKAAGSLPPAAVSWFALRWCVLPYSV